MNIYKELQRNDDGVIMTLKDIYNLRQKIFDEDRNGTFSRLFEFLTSRNYHIRYRINEEKMLDAIFVTHQSGLEKGQRFPEVVVMDATY